MVHYKVYFQNKLCLKFINNYVWVSVGLFSKFAGDYVRLAAECSAGDLHCRSPSSRPENHTKITALSFISYLVRVKPRVGTLLGIATIWLVTARCPSFPPYLHLSQLDDELCLLKLHVHPLHALFVLKLLRAVRSKVMRRSCVRSQLITRIDPACPAQSAHIVLVSD